MTKSLAALLCVSATWASAQEPEMCPPILRAQWEAKRKAILEAKKGDKDYLPRPFPETEEDFRADLRYSFFKLFYPRTKDPEKARPWHRELFQRLKDNSFDLQVVPVTVWAGPPCENLAFSVRVFRKPAPGKARFNPGDLLAAIEMGRHGEIGVVQVTTPQGYPKDMVVKIPRPEDRLSHSPQDPSLLQHVVEERLGMEGVSILGYVAAIWYDGGCPVNWPCILFESAGKRYLFAKSPDPKFDVVFLLEREPRLMLRKQFLALGGPMDADQARRAFLVIREQTGRQVLSWGYDHEGNELMALVSYFKPGELPTPKP